jgi:hypothetical protein
MINNQSDKPEKLEPKDSERKDIKHPTEDSEAVLKPEDQEYHKDEADFQPPPAESKEKSEQPVHPIKDAPKDN